MNTNDIDSKNDINDKRTETDFKHVTFSKFQKSKVKMELVKCLQNNKVEAACNWVAELVCAGHYVDIWDCFILVLSKYIHLGNPKLPLYLAMRITQFRQILNNGYVTNELSMRNNSKIRQLFTEITGVLCYSRKSHSIDQIKILKTEEFNINHMALRLKAPKVTYAQEIFQPDDPKELFVAVNELAFHLSKESKNNLTACYWYEWIMEYNHICRSRKEKCVAQTRTHIPVADKYRKDVVWLVWDAIISAGQAKNDKVITKILNALLDIYCLKYGESTKSRRRYVVYFAISLVTEMVDLSLEMLNNQKEVEFMGKKVDVIYKTIKKNEVSPNMDYLMNGVAAPEKSNREKTIERLEMMSGF